MTTLALAEIRFRQFLALTKPRVVSLIVFCAVIGMFLAVPGLPPPGVVFFATLGIALVAGAAAAINCLVEQKIDALMQRTRGRPLPRGQITSGVDAGLRRAGRRPRPLAAPSLREPADDVAHARDVRRLRRHLHVVLKPATPQNIVIGGASGAMPPVLGWAAVTNTVSPEALLLFLIIFAWTPPHFWALALYRTQDYAKAGLPMLPVTHGPAYTRLQIVLYTCVLVAVTLLPYAIRMSGLPTSSRRSRWAGVFLAYAVQLYRDYSDELARATFRYSILYLTLLFSALLVDHYL